MSFADWKKRNTIMADSIPDGLRPMAYLVAQAAYKAGERAGLKTGEDIAKRAIALRELMRSDDAL